MSCTAIGATGARDKVSAGVNLARFLRRAWFRPRAARTIRSQLRADSIMAARTETWSEFTPWAYAIVAIPVVLLAVEIVRGALAEIDMVRSQTLRGTLQESRGQALGWVKGLSVLLENQQAVDRSWHENR